MQMPNAQFVYPGGQAPSPLETLTKMMMMKQQYEQEEKARQEQFKAQAERDKLQQEGEMTLAKLKAQMETDAKNAQFQEQLKQAMGAYGNLEGSLSEGQPGYDLLPWAKYYAQQGEAMPISPFTASIGAQGRENVAQTQGQNRLDVEGLKGQTARDVTRMKTESAERIQGSRLAGLKANIAMKRDLAKANNDIRMAIAQIRAGGSPEQKSEMAAAKLVEYVAKNIAGGDEVTSEHRAQAIEELGTMFPDTFSQYVQAVEETQPGWLYKLTLGMFGGSEKTLRQPMTQTAPTKESVKSKFNIR